MPGVTYEGVVVLRSVPQIFFGMSRLATLLLSLGFGQACTTRLDLDAKAVLFIMKYP